MDPSKVLDCKTNQQKPNCMKKLHSNIIDMCFRFDFFFTILLTCRVGFERDEDNVSFH